VLGSIGAGAIVLVLLAVFVVPKIFGGSSTALIKQYASADTFVVASVDLQNIIKSDLYKKLGLEELVNDGMKGAPTTLKPEDISTIVVLMDKPRPGRRLRQEPTVVFRMTRDIPFKEMLDPKMAAMVKEYEGVEYVALGRRGVLAKTDTATVCMLSTGGMTAFKKLISRLKEGKADRLNESLRSAMDQVSGEASFMAMYVPESMKDEITKGPPVLASIRSAGLGFSVGSGVELKVAAAFSKEEDAEAALKIVDGFKAAGVQAIKGMVSDAKDNDVKSVLGVVAKTLNAIKLRQDGSQVLADASVAGSDIILIKDKYAKVLPAIMGGGPSTGGKPGGDPLSAIMGLFGQ